MKTHLRGHVIQNVHHNMINSLQDECNGGNG